MKSIIVTNKYDNADLYKSMFNLIETAKKKKVDIVIFAPENAIITEQTEKIIQEYVAGFDSNTVFTPGFTNVSWRDYYFICTPKQLKTIKFDIEKTKQYGAIHNSNGIGWFLETEWKANEYIIHNPTIELFEKKEIMPELRPHEIVYKRIGGMATYPARLKSCIQSIESVIKQLDVLWLCLNEYNNEIPAEILNLQAKYNGKFQWFVPNKNITDIGKFHNSRIYKDCYFFGLDDDIIYPSTYVSDTVNRMIEYGNNAILTYHGRNYTLPVQSYYNGAKEVFNYLSTVINDVYVNVGGTGVCCFHTDKFNIDYTKFETNKMADIWFSLFANAAKIPIICLKHTAGYFKSLSQIGIQAEMKNNDSVQTKLINSIKFENYTQINASKNYNSVIIRYKKNGLEIPADRRKIQKLLQLGTIEIIG